MRLDTVCILSSISSIYEISGGNMRDESLCFSVRSLSVINDYVKREEALKVLGEINAKLSSYTKFSEASE